MNHLWMRNATAAVLVGGVVLVSPAYAQLHGDWPSDFRWQHSGNEARPDTQRVSARQSDSELGIPRGDLRKDVSENSRQARPQRSR